MAALSDLKIWLAPLSFLAGGILLGLVVESLILGKFRKIASKTDLEVDNIAADSLRGLPFLWFVMGGLYGAVLVSPIPISRVTLIEKILQVILILSLTVLIARISTRSVDAYTRKQVGVSASFSILKNLCRGFILILGLLTIFYTLGMNVTPVLTALGVGGLAVALALQDPLANFFSGLQILASRQISLGDYVKLETGEEGYVSDITWRYTTLITLPNNRVIVPNVKLASNLVTNFYLPSKEVAIPMQATVSYGSDLAKVERVTIEVAESVMKEIPGAVPDFQPALRFHTFGDSGIQFSVLLRAREYSDQPLIKHEFIKRLHDRYNKEGIQIPYPTRTIYMEQKES